MVNLSCLLKTKKKKQKIAEKKHYVGTEENIYSKLSSLIYYNYHCWIQDFLQIGYKSYMKAFTFSCCTHMENLVYAFFSGGHFRKTFY